MHCIALSAGVKHSLSTGSGAVVHVPGSSEQTLIDRVAGGDREAMRVLYGRFSLRVYRFALRLGADEGTAEDIVSEVFLEFWRRAASFKARSKLSTWLLSIAHNKLASKRRRRSPEPLDEAAVEAMADAADGPEAILQKMQAASIVAQALDQLSPAHHEIIDLAYYHEKSISEVARILGIPEATVKTRMFHARKRLAQALVQRGHGEALLHT
jgi:RNA polymerase sigma-70 factor (ECF subfamily)